MWQYAYLDTVKAFQNAVYRYARKLQLMHNRRLHTTLPFASKAAYEAYEHFLTIEYPNGTCALSDRFLEQRNSAEEAVKAVKESRANNHAGRRQAA